MTIAVQSRSGPSRRTMLAAAGFGWSLFGVYQFGSTSFAGEAGLMASGMTAEQATLYAGLPAWMIAAFAIGVFGGTIGSALLILGQPLARVVLATSLAAYAVLFAGDWALGVFDAFGASQVALLGLVLVIAAGLCWLAEDLRR